MKTFIGKLNSYFDNTSLHGFSYISGKRHLAEKIFWVIAIFCSFCCCLNLFYQLIGKIEKNPVIVVSPDTPTHIKDISFPAISFCTDSLFNRNYNIFSSILLLSNESNPFDMMECISDCKYKNWKDPQFYIEYFPSINAIWLKKFYLIENITISPYGWCNTFNILDEKEMFHENSKADYFKYQQPIVYNYHLDLVENNETAPLSTRIKKTGFRGTINPDDLKHISCKIDSEEYQQCSYNWEITVVVHSSNELVDKRHRRLNIQRQTSSNLFIEPQIRITDETLLGLAVDERRCYKPNEKKLKFFKAYTSINCLKECESSFILQKCGCVPYYFINNDTSLICNTSQLDCFQQEYEKFIELNCKCYPPCEDINYEFVGNKFSKKYFNLFVNKMASIEFTAEFKEDSYYPLIRRKYFAMTDWFSFVGGIFGLFFGFSFLSAFEIIFHALKDFFDGKWTKKIVKRKIKIENSLKQRSRDKYFRFRRFLWIFVNFLESSSIHGLAYLANNKIKFYERFAWLISIILSIAACIFMTFELHKKLTIDAISMISGHEHYNITQIPFPALTFMSIHVYDDKMTYDPEWRKLMNRRDFDFRQLQELTYKIVRESYSPKYIFYDLPKFPRGNITNYGQKMIWFMKKYADFMFTRYLNFSWGDDFLVPTANLLTSLAFGFTFNIVPCDEIFNISSVSDNFFYNFENHFQGGSKNKTSNNPWKSSFNDREILLITSDKFRFELPFVSVHSPFEYPFEINLADKNLIEMHAWTTTLVLIIPEVVTISSDFAKLSLNQRRCYLDDERNLIFFKKYTQRNCEIECLSKRLIETCGCIPFDIIRGNETKICEFFDTICVFKTRTLFNEDEKLRNSCKCLPLCSYISYNYEIMTIKHIERPSEGSMIFKFKENEFISMQRIRQFTIFDFLSYIGGLFGLFAGISVLSFFEIFYFFSLRLICEFLIIKREKRRVGHENIVIVTPTSLE